MWQDYANLPGDGRPGTLADQWGRPIEGCEHSTDKLRGNTRYCYACCQHPDLESRLGWVCPDCGYTYEEIDPDGANILENLAGITYASLSQDDMARQDTAERASRR